MFLQARWRILAHAWTAHAAKVAELSLLEND